MHLSLLLGRNPKKSAYFALSNHIIPYGIYSGERLSDLF